MSGIAVLVPNEMMYIDTIEILKEENYYVNYVKKVTSADVVAEAREAIKGGSSIIVARGTQAALIKKFTNVPINEIVLTAQEVGLLIVKAKKILINPFPVIAIIGIKNMLCDMKHFNELYGIQLNTYLLDDFSKINSAVRQAAVDGAEIIISGEMGMQVAYELGIPSIFLTGTEESIRNALHTAKKLYYASELEKRTNAHISTLMDCSFAGIIRTNMKGIITDYNHIIESIMNFSAKKIIGLKITDIIKELDEVSVEKVLNEEEENYTTFLTINNVGLVIIMAPIIVDGKIDGAIFSCNRVKKSENVEASQIKEKYLRGYVAFNTFDDIIKVSEAMNDTVELAKVFAQSSSPILLIGESGTEKEIFAQSIHNHSLRKNGPYISVNITGLTEVEQLRLLFGDEKANINNEKYLGAVGMANLGTLHINAIDKLSLLGQYQLIKAIRNKTLVRNDMEKIKVIDTRIIASASNDLINLMLAGKFRNDLFYIFSSLSLNIPPLRKRKEDLEVKIDNYLKKFSEQLSRYYKLTKEAKRFLVNYPWIGNDDQLEGFCERMVLTVGKRRITEQFVSDLMKEVYSSLYNGEIEENLVISTDPYAELIMETLRRFKGNRKLTSKELGISTSTLWRYMKKFNIID